MKKKVIAIFMVLTVLTSLLVGCGSSSDSGTVHRGISEDEPEEMTLEFSFGTRTGTYYGDINEDGLPDGEGTFSSENDKGIKYTYTGDWVNGHWEGNGTQTWDDGQVYEGEYSNDLFEGYGEHTFSDGNVYKGNFSEGDLNGEGTYYFPSGAYFEGEFTSAGNGEGTYYDSEGNSYIAHMVDGEITTELPYDFFTEEEHQEQYETLYKSYQFTELYDYVNDYITAQGDEILPSDSAYSIIELVEPLLDYQDTWTVTQDDFDGSNFVTFKGADEISRTESIDLKLSGSNLETTVGFQKSDWLFFDRFSLSVDANVVESHSVESWDVDTDVISGGTIEESYSNNRLFNKHGEEIKNGETVMIRFENTDNGDQYDHTLTEDEKTAIYVGNLLRDNWVELSNLLTQYKVNAGEE